MGFFESKKVTDLKANLNKAVKDGDTDGLARVLMHMNDLPKSVLMGAFEKAVKNGQSASAAILLKHGADPQKLNANTIVDIVNAKDIQMFRLLAEHGLDFSTKNFYEKASYFDLVQLLKKSVECENLKAANDILRKELEASRKRVAELEKQADVYTTKGQLKKSGY